MTDPISRINNGVGQDAVNVGIGAGRDLQRPAWPHTEPRQVDIAAKRQGEALPLIDRDLAAVVDSGVIVELQGAVFVSVRQHAHDINAVIRVRGRGDDFGGGILRHVKGKLLKINVLAERGRNYRLPLGNVSELSGLISVSVRSVAVRANACIHAAQFAADGPGGVCGHGCVGGRAGCAIQIIVTGALVAVGRHLLRHVIAVSVAEGCARIGAHAQGHDALIAGCVRGVLSLRRRRDPRNDALLRGQDLQHVAYVRAFGIDLGAIPAYRPAFAGSQFHRLRTGAANRNHAHIGSGAVEHRPTILIEGRDLLRGSRKGFVRNVHGLSSRQSVPLAGLLNPLSAEDAKVGGAVPRHERQADNVPVHIRPTRGFWKSQHVIGARAGYIFCCNRDIGVKGVFLPTESPLIRLGGIPNDNGVDGLRRSAMWGVCDRFGEFVRVQEHILYVACHSGFECHSL